MNTLDVIVKPMERGQITLPQKFRKKLGISKDTLLNISLEEDRLIVMPLKELIGNLSPAVIRPKIAKKKYLEMLKGFKGDLWTKEDDSARKRMKDNEQYPDW